MICPTYTCDRVHFLDTPFDLVSEDFVLEFLLNRAHARHSFEYIVTPNADHVVRNFKNSELLSIYNNALLSVCDSRVVARLASTKGFPIHHIITGSDLTLKLFDNILNPEHKITVIGCENNIISLLKSKYHLNHLYHHNPPMGFIHSKNQIQECCQFIVEHPSDFILLAVGSPQQELLAGHLKAIPESKGIGLCIGASLLFLTGIEKRAPRIFSKLGIEWLFRLLQNPKRLWYRYYHDLKILKMTIRSRRYNHSQNTRVLKK